jgi:Dihydrofolate reductase
MKKIKIYSVVSLDGYTARTDGDIDWAMDWVAEHTAPGGNDYGFNDFAKTTGSAIVNMPYYYLIRSYDVCWPLAGMKSYVLADPNFGVPADKDTNVFPWAADDSKADEMINRLLDEGEGDIWIVGDYSLISFFAEQGLISEVVLNILPVTLGEGQRLIFGSRESAWKLTDTKIHDNGVVQLKYSLNI